MKHLWLTAYTDIIESLRARWFLVYSLVFGGIVVILFAFGLSDCAGQLEYLYHCLILLLTHLY